MNILNVLIIQWYLWNDKVYPNIAVVRDTHNISQLRDREFILDFVFGSNEKPAKILAAQGTEHPKQVSNGTEIPWE